MAALQARTHETDYSALPAARAALEAWGAFEEADEGPVVLAP